MPAIRALLLDLDGTLLDTEPLHFEAHRRFLQSVGITPTEAELAGNIGKGDQSFYAELIRRHGSAGEAAAWVAGKTRVLIDLYRQGGVPLRPGVAGLLDHAAGAGIPCIIVTSSERSLADSALTVAGLAARLPLRVCREDTARHKPQPDPFMLAASLLGLPARQCLVIEDSASGVAAGRAAGCPVVALHGDHVPDAALWKAGAQMVVERLDALVPLVDLVFAAAAVR